MKGSKKLQYVYQFGPKTTKNTSETNRILPDLIRLSFDSLTIVTRRHRQEPCTGKAFQRMLRPLSFPSLSMGKTRPCINLFPSSRLQEYARHSFIGKRGSFSNIRFHSSFQTSFDKSGHRDIKTARGTGHLLKSPDRLISRVLRFASSYNRRSVLKEQCSLFLRAKRTKSEDSHSMNCNLWQVQ